MKTGWLVNSTEIQARVNRGLDWNRGTRESKKWLNLTYIVKISWQYLFKIADSIFISISILKMFLKYGNNSCIIFNLEILRAYDQSRSF